MAVSRPAIARFCVSRAGIRSLTTRNIFEPDSSERSMRGQSSKQQSPDEKPWDGDESVADSVLRMIMDKYNKPLRVEGAAKRQMPQVQVHPPQVRGLYDEQQDDASMSSGAKAKLRDKLSRSKKQKRIMNARDAALDYSLEQKYPSSQTPKLRQQQQDDEDNDAPRPRSITEIGLLAEERIREARAKGHFDNLPGRGKPIPVDMDENNPFVDRTEYFLNRIVQRQGAAPPWIMMQQQVDTEVTKFRTSLERSMELCMMDGVASRTQVLRDWTRQNGGYFGKLMDQVNQQVRSYNVMCPASVRKNRIDLDDELGDAYRRLTTARDK